MHSVKTLVANTLARVQRLAKIAPTIVTDRHPYLLTKDEEIGPGIKIYKLLKSEKNKRSERVVS